MTINNLKSCDTTEKLFTYLDSKVDISADFKGRRIKFQNEGTGVDNVSIRNIVEQLKTAIDHDKQTNAKINPEHIRKILKKIDKFNTQADLAKSTQNPLVRLVIFIRSFFGNIGFNKKDKLAAIREEFSKDFEKSSVYVKGVPPKELAKLLINNLGSEAKEELKKCVVVMEKILNLLDAQNFTLKDGKLDKTLANLAKFEKIKETIEALGKELQDHDNTQPNPILKAINKELLISKEKGLEEFLKTLKKEDFKLFRLIAMAHIDDPKAPSIVTEDSFFQKLKAYGELF